MVNDAIVRAYNLIEPIKFEWQIKHKGKIITMEATFKELRNVQFKGDNEFSLICTDIKTKECKDE